MAWHQDRVAWAVSFWMIYFLVNPLIRHQQKLNLWGGAELWVQERESAELLPEVLQASRAVVAERMGQFPLVVKEQGQGQEVVGLAWQKVKERPAGLAGGHLMQEPEWEQGQDFLQVVWVHQGRCLEL